MALRNSNNSPSLLSHVFRYKRLFAALLSVILAGSSAIGEFPPEKPIKIIVPTNTGGEVDTLARIFQRAFQKHKILPVKTVVVNLDGAGGTIGTRKKKIPHQMDTQSDFDSWHRHFQGHGHRQL